MCIIGRKRFLVSVSMAVVIPNQSEPNEYSRLTHSSASSRLRSVPFELPHLGRFQNFTKRRPGFQPESNQILAAHEWRRNDLDPLRSDARFQGLVSAILSGSIK